MSAHFQLNISNEILLKTYDVTDTAILYRTIHEHHNFLRPWISWVDRIQSEKDALELIQQGHHLIGEQTAMPLMIWHQHQFAGGIGFHDWNHDLQIAKIGYWLIPQAQGKGIVTSSAIGLINYLFTSLHLHKIVLEYFPENEKSAKVAVALGFTIEGLIRKTMKHQGAYRDLVVCGLLREEWSNKPANH